MKPIKIFTSPALQTFNRLANHLENRTINSPLPILEISEKLGKGTILALDIFDDISVILFSGHFKNDLLLDLITNVENPLNFIYNCNTPFNYKYGNKNAWRELDQFQHAIISNSSNTNIQVKLKANKRYYSYIISISKAVYLNNRNYCTQTIAAYLKIIFEKKDKTPAYFHNGSYNLEIANILKQVNLENFSSFEHRIFLEAKIHELINQHLLQYKRDIDNSANTSNLFSYEVKAIHEAAVFIQNHIDEIKTVGQVARYVGLNSNKLQRGFNQIFNISVNSFIRNARMSKAEELLINSEETICQIVSKIGLNSNSYFSRLFKKKYKVSPSQFRIKNRTIN
ncbi:AraC family transcriptional regulator [Salegentibacter agarivorans]|uniref:AraC-type DNA-binding protein n=1 Tax=Salegentibacter agarivorans TaxID=345907 RepID=A0A1I2NAG8_9FLAO|nr:AraC family transcriptional regulator [Salegentibacter agarivorans]SFG00905.1 AraC-type DNA-binding protein [Salegentibacter agarivorans]